MTESSVKNDCERTGIVHGESEPSMPPNPGAILGMFHEPLDQKHDGNEEEEERKVGALHAGLEEQNRIKVLERK